MCVVWVWRGRGVGVAWAWRGCVGAGPNSVLWGQEEFQCDMQGANSGPLSRNIIPLAAIPPLHCCHAYFYLIWSHYAPNQLPMHVIVYEFLSKVVQRCQLNYIGC